MMRRLSGKAFITFASAVFLTLLVSNVHADPVRVNKLSHISSSAPVGTSSQTTASFTPANNSLLLAIVSYTGHNMTQDKSADITLAGGGLIWTRRLYVGTGTGYGQGLAVFTAPVTTGLAMTLTLDAGANNIWAYGCQVFQYTNYNTSSPIGATATKNNAVADGAETLTLSATPASTSEVLGFYASYPNTTVATTQGSGWTELYDAGTGAYTHLHSQAKVNVGSTAVPWADVAASGTQQSGIAAAIEIKSADTTTITPHEITSASTGGVCNAPANIVAGNLLVASFLQGSKSGNPTLPSGWVLDRTQDFSSSAYRLCVAHKIAGGSEPGTYTFSGYGGSGIYDLSIVRMDGNDTSNPVDSGALAGSSAASSSTTYAFPTVTTAYANDLLYYVGEATGTPSCTWPSGTLELYDPVDGHSAGYEIKSTSGVSTARNITWSASSSERMGIVVAYKSATTGTTTYTVTPTAGANGSISPNTAQVVSQGSTTAFTVTPNTGYSAVVTGCSGTLSGNTYTTGPITANCTVSATFVINTYTVTPSAGANGSISPSTVRVVSHGSTTAFTVTPNTGYQTSTVTGCSGTLSGSTYTTGPITANCTVSATFVINTYTITASAGANGSISPSGSVVVSSGTSTTFTITPNSGYMIATVTVDGSSVATNPTYTFTNITANHTISATFSVNTYTITASAGANGSISPSGSVVVSGGTGTTFTMTANTGYSITDVIVDGASVGAITSYTFSNVTANHTITANFADITPPTVTITSPTAITTRDNNPLLSYTVNDGTVVVRVNGNIVSKMSGSNLDMLPDGHHTVIVEATDGAGNKGSATVSFDIDSTAPLTISGVEASAHVINTAFFESSNIYFSMNGRAAVTLKIYIGSTYPVENPKYTITQNVSNAGVFSFTWDGKDNAGNVLRDSDYLYVLSASAGSATATYSPAAPTGTGTVTCTQEASSDPYKNDPLTISYSVSRAARIDIRISAGLTTFSVLENVGHAAGNYTFDWDGRDKSGAIVSAGAVAKCYVMSLLYDNHIVTTGDAPKIASLQSDPYEINLAYGHIARIKYNLLKDANVTVKLTPPAGTAITLVDNQLQTAGPIEVAWNGLFDQQDKLFAVSQEGVYTIQVIARNPLTGSEYQMRGSLSVAY